MQNERYSLFLNDLASQPPFHYRILTRNTFFITLHTQHWKWSRVFQFHSPHTFSNFSLLPFLFLEKDFIFTSYAFLLLFQILFVSEISFCVRVCVCTVEYTYLVDEGRGSLQACFVFPLFDPAFGLGLCTQQNTPLHARSMCVWGCVLDPSQKVPYYIVYLQQRRHRRRSRLI